MVIGPVLIVFGNYCPKIPQNLVAGIRVPWTMNSEEVWNRTHRIAGLAIVFLEPIFSRPPSVGIAAVVSAAIASTIYSFWVYIKLGKPNDFRK